MSDYCQGDCGEDTCVMPGCGEDRCQFCSRWLEDCNCDDDGAEDAYAEHADIRA